MKRAKKSRCGNYIVKKDDIGNTLVIGNTIYIVSSVIPIDENAVIPKRLTDYFDIKKLTNKSRNTSNVYERCVYTATLSMLGYKPDEIKELSSTGRCSVYHYLKTYAKELELIQLIPSYNSELVNDVKQRLIKIKQHDRATVTDSRE